MNKAYEAGKVLTKAQASNQVSDQTKHQNNESNNPATSQTNCGAQRTLIHGNETSQGKENPILDKNTSTNVGMFTSSVQQGDSPSKNTSLPTGMEMDSVRKKQNTRKNIALAYTVREYTEILCSNFSQLYP